jgi:hypothetical protein
MPGIAWPVPPPTSHNCPAKVIAGRVRCSFVSPVGVNTRAGDAPGIFNGRMHDACVRFQSAFGLALMLMTALRAAAGRESFTAESTAYLRALQRRASASTGVGSHQKPDELLAALLWHWQTKGGRDAMRPLMLLLILCGWVTATALSGCATASVPMATAEADGRGKSFTPLPDRGAIYFFRESKVASALSLWVATDQQTLGALATGTWFRVDLVPGSYVVTCAPFEWALKYSGPMIVPHIPTNIQLAADEIRFIKIEVDRARCVGVEMPPEKGRAAVLASRRAGENPAFAQPAFAKPNPICSPT